MRTLLILTAGVALAACHRTGENVGAAPNRGDTTVVRTDTTAARTDTGAVTHAIDTTRTGPPGEAGRPGNATVTADSVAIPDTTRPTDSLNRAAPPQDTLGPRAPTGADTTRMGNDSTGVGQMTRDSMGAMHDSMGAKHDSM